MSRSTKLAIDSRRALLAATVAALGLAGCNATPTAGPRYSAKLLARTAARFPALKQLSRLELSLPFDALFDSPLQRRTFLGELRSVGTSDERATFVTPVTLRPVGHFTRLICRYPKLAVSLPGRSGRHTRLFLVPHCADAGNKGGVPDEQHLRRHHLVYRLQAALDLPRLATRLVRLDYLDSRGGGKARRRLRGKLALLLEDAADLARRRVGDARRLRIRLDEKGSYRQLDADASARFHLFQVLINNHDWQIFDLQSLGRYARKDAFSVKLHNTIVLDPRPAEDKPLPVAFDFDLSSLVGVPESVRDLVGARFERHLDQLANPAFLKGKTALYRWIVLRLQHARRHHGASADRARRYFQRRESALRAVAAAAAKPDALRAGRHLDAFYGALKAHYALPWVKQSAALRDARANGRVLCHVRPNTPVHVLERQGAQVRVRLTQRMLLVWGKRPVASCVGAGKAVDTGWLAEQALSSRGDSRDSAKDERRP